MNSVFSINQTRQSFKATSPRPRTQPAGKFGGTRPTAENGGTYLTRIVIAFAGQKQWRIVINMVAELILLQCN